MLKIPRFLLSRFSWQRNWLNANQNSDHSPEREIRDDGGEASQPGRQFYRPRRRCSGDRIPI